MAPAPLRLSAALALASLTAGCFLVVPVPLPQKKPAPVPEATADHCGAAGLQGLIGQPETALATMRFRQPIRIIHPGQAVTMDYSENRLNLEIDARGRISAVRCG